MNRASEICGTTSNVYLRIYIYKKKGVREEQKILEKIEAKIFPRRLSLKTARTK